MPHESGPIRTALSWKPYGFQPVVIRIATDSRTDTKMQPYGYQDVAVQLPADSCTTLSCQPYGSLPDNRTTAGSEPYG